MHPTPAVPAQKAAGATITAGFALTGRDKVEQNSAIDIPTVVTC